MPLSIRSPAIRKNPLLIKAEVGKPKPSLQELPQGNHTYGLPSRVKATDHDTTGSGRFLNLFFFMLLFEHIFTVIPVSCYLRY